MIKHTLAIIGIIFLLALSGVIGGAYLLRTIQTQQNNAIELLTSQHEHIEHSLQNIEAQLSTLQNQITATGATTLPSKEDTIRKQPAILPNELLGSRLAGDPLCSIPVDQISYPIAPEYAHLNELGRFFTAYSCSIDQVNSLQEVENKRYIAGIELALANAPDASFLNILKRLGFTCNETTAAVRCTSWKLNTPLSIDALIKLEAFTSDITQASCLYCSTSDETFLNKTTHDDSDSLE